MKKMNKKKWIVSIGGILLLIFMYFVYINNSCPIKGTYAYAPNANVRFSFEENKYIFKGEPIVTLSFKNGKYIFEGEGNEFEEIVKWYGNNEKYDFEEIKVENDSYEIKTYKYYLKGKDMDFPITITVDDAGKLILCMGSLSVPTRVFYRIDN